MKGRSAAAWATRRPGAHLRVDADLRPRIKEGRDRDWPEGGREWPEGGRDWPGKAGRPPADADLRPRPKEARGLMGGHDRGGP